MTIPLVSGEGRYWLSVIRHRGIFVVLVSGPVVSRNFAELTLHSLYLTDYVDGSTLEVVKFAYCGR